VRRVSVSVERLSYRLLGCIAGLDWALGTGLNGRRAN
jgi:hypothetical protein